MLVIAGATIFSFIVSYERLDTILLNFFVGLTSGAAIVISQHYGAHEPDRVLIPLASSFGLSMVHIGVVVVLNAMIGLLTPPVGYSLYVLNSVTGYPVMKIAKWCIPWMIPLVFTLLVITLVPGISMWLPTLLGIA